MDEQVVLKMFDEGHSVDYIIGYLVVEWNKNTKQFDSLHHQWLINKPKYSRQDVTRFVYQTLLNRHLNVLKGGKVNAK